MNKKLEELCGNIKKSRDLREREDAAGVERNYTIFYSRIGCFECSGGFEKESECIRYHLDSENINNANLEGE